MSVYIKGEDVDRLEAFYQSAKKTAGELSLRTHVDDTDENQHLTIEAWGRVAGIRQAAEIIGIYFDTEVK